MTSIRPKPSTPIPARTKLEREDGDARSTIAASTRNHPASNNKNPKIFMEKAPGSR